jgi:hypothetical protein
MDNLTLKLFEAYYSARKNKRNTYNQLKFEIDYESNLFRLSDEIIQNNYQIKPSIAFIINKPVMREIFAADFRDRVVHHLLYNCLNPVIDKKLINDTYSCRKNKGTLYGIKRTDKFIRACTKNYQKQAWILKLDIQGYFMNMNRQYLWQKLINILGNSTNFDDINREIIDYLLKKVIFNQPTQDCIIKGTKKDWVGLPNSKSLFHSPANCGLPIGNLTSQIFGNVYLNDLDHYIKRELKVKYYGRYVDDMIFIHESKKYLKQVIEAVGSKLSKDGMIIHPRKIYLQHYTKGVLFLGQYIKPYRKYISKRTKNNFYKLIIEINELLSSHNIIAFKKLKYIQARLNSYLGIFKHANTYKLIEKMSTKFSEKFWYFFCFSKNYSRVFINEKNWEWHYIQIYQFTN